MILLPVLTNRHKLSSPSTTALATISPSPGPGQPFALPERWASVLLFPAAVVGCDCCYNKRHTTEMHLRVKSTMAASAWPVVSPSDCGTQLLSSVALPSILRASESLLLAASRGTDVGEGITVLNSFTLNCSHSTSHHSSRGHTWMQGGWEVPSSFRWWLPNSSKLRWGSSCFGPSSL